jgi:hypothetical protein
VSEWKEILLKNFVAIDGHYNKVLRKSKVAPVLNEVLRHEEVWGGKDVKTRVFLTSALVGGE